MIKAESLNVKLVYEIEDSLRVAKFLRNQGFLYRNDVLLTTGMVFFSFILLILFLADDFGALRIVGAMVFSAIPALTVGIAVFCLHRFLNPWLIGRTIARHFHSSPTENKETLISFSEAGIETVSELTSTFTKWEAVTRVIESNSDFLFYSGRALTLFLPKRSINVLEGAKNVKNLILKMVGESAFFQTR